MSSVWIETLGGDERRRGFCLEVGWAWMIVIWEFGGELGEEIGWQLKVEWWWVSLGGGAFGGMFTATRASKLGLFSPLRGSVSVSAGCGWRQLVLRNNVSAVVTAVKARLPGAPGKRGVTNSRLLCCSWRAYG